MNLINSFTGDNSFLSNFYPCSVLYEGIEYPSAETAFQAAKCADIQERQKFQYLSAGDAKKAGKKVSLRSDWEDAKVGIMRKIISLKFENNPILADKLVRTGDAELVEGNNWHDNFWGNCGCERCKNVPGKNMLGYLLMECREATISRRKDNNELFLGFSCLSRQDYGADYIARVTTPKGYSDEIFFGLYVKNDGCISEAAVRWITLDKRSAPHFEVFTDGFEMFYDLIKSPEVRDFIKANPDFTSDDFSRLLLKQGYVDRSDKKLSEEA